MQLNWLVTAIAAVLMMPSAASAENVAVSVDVSAAMAVLDTVRNPHLTASEALKIARLPGNQGLILKAKSYGRTATDALFAQVLVAASHQDKSFVDVSRFRFDDVREHAAQTEQAITGLRDPQLHLLDTVKARDCHLHSLDPEGSGDRISRRWWHVGRVRVRQATILPQPRSFPVGSSRLDDHGA